MTALEKIQSEPVPVSDTTLPCSRCGKPVPTNSGEVQSIASLFGRPPAVLCEWCEKGKPDAVEQSPPRPLPEWPECWPSRALRDLPGFTGPPLDKARDVWSKLKDNGTIVIVGDRGRGKTVMACWLAHQRRLEHKHPGIYIRSHDLFATIRRAWHPQSKQDEWDVLERYRQAAFLVVDEFQERSESEWENRTLVNILDHRHADIRPTVLIANLSADGFAQSVGPSLADRIAQTGGIVECAWGNMRTQ
jgi:DNA replication protein DnaC